MQILKEEVKEDIECAAKKLFLEKGYEKTSLRGIAEKAGVSKSNIYNYFKSKEQLFMLLTQNIRANIFQFEEIFERHLFSDAPFGSEEFIDNLSEGLFQYILSYREEYILLMNSGKGSPFGDSKAEMAAVLEKHIKHSMSNHDDDFVIEVISCNFIEGMVKIAQEELEEEKRKDQLKKLLKYHITGVSSLFKAG